MEKMLTAEEEIELIRRAKEGDRAAIERLMLSYARLAYAMARRMHSIMRPRYLEIKDLVQENFLSFYGALRAYEMGGNANFRTYWIRHMWWDMKRVIRNAQIIRYPPYSSPAKERNPQHKEASEPVYTTTPMAAIKILSLDDYAYECGDETLSEMMEGYAPSPEDSLLEKEREQLETNKLFLAGKTPEDAEKEREQILQGTVEKAVKEVSLEPTSERNMEIYCMKYGILGFSGPHMLQDVARKFGITPQSVQKIIRRIDEKSREIASYALLNKETSKTAEWATQIGLPAYDDAVPESEYVQTMYRMVERAARESSRKGKRERNMRIYCTKYGIFGFGGPQKNEDVARQFGLKKGEILYVVSNVNKKLMEITYNPPDEKASEIEKTLVAILERKSTFMRSRAYKGRLSEVIDDYYAHTSEDSLLEKDYEQSLYRMVERVARESSRKSTWERNMHIYCMRYGILGFDTPRTFEYIGTQFGICRARAQGVISNMDRKLKKIATLSPPSPPASTHGIRPA